MGIVGWKIVLCGLLAAAALAAAVVPPGACAGEDVPAARGRGKEMALAKRVERANRLYESGKFREANNLYRSVLRRARSVARGEPALPFQPDPFTEETLLKVRSQLSRDTREAIIDALIERGDRFLVVGDEDGAVDEYEKVFLLDAGNRKASAGMDRARARALARLREARESITAHAE